MLAKWKEQSPYSCTMKEAATQVPLDVKIAVRKELGKLGHVTMVPAEQGQTVGIGKPAEGADINDFLPSLTPVPNSC